MLARYNNVRSGHSFVEGGGPGPLRPSVYEISKSTGFHVDFGFQIGFLDFKVNSGFCLVILKILLMNNDVFSAQMHTEYNVIALHSSPLRSAY